MDLLASIVASSCVGTLSPPTPGPPSRQDMPGRIALIRPSSQLFKFSRSREAFTLPVGRANDTDGARAVSLRRYKAVATGALPPVARDGYDDRPPVPTTLDGDGSPAGRTASSS